MSQDTNIPNLVINKLNKQQYEGITPNATELYFITDEDAYLASNQGSGNAGKVLTVGNDGTVSPQNIPAGTTDYNDLTNKPSINNVALSGDKTASDLGFANVAMTAEYSDLLNTPSIPSPQVNSDWNATSGIAEILNKPILSTVATSGDYNDLINKPTIPTNLANVAFTGDYNDLSNTPVLGTAAYADAGDFATAEEGSLAATAVQPGDLADVATTGEYSDLINTPTLSNVATSGDYNDLTNKPTIPTVSDATIIITQGGVQKGSFTLNQASGDTIALDAGGGSPLPSQTGHSGEFLTTNGTDASWTNLANVAISGEYNALLNAPTNLSQFTDDTNLATVLFRTWGVND